MKEGKEKRLCPDMGVGPSKCRFSSWLPFKPNKRNMGVGGRFSTWFPVYPNKRCKKGKHPNGGPDGFCAPSCLLEDGDPPKAKQFQKAFYVQVFPPTGAMFALQDNVSFKVAASIEGGPRQVKGGVGQSRGKRVETTSLRAPSIGIFG